MAINRKNPAVGFISDALLRYPCSEIRDIYKLLYQAFHGADHAVVDHVQASEWLHSEWKSMSPIDQDDHPPVLESIYIKNVTPSLYRLHLAPAKLLGFDPVVILAEFIRTAEEFPKEYPEKNIDLHTAFINIWSELGRMISLGELEINAGDYNAFTTEVERIGWPAVHHSDAYRQAYDPHYRLVMNPELAVCI